MNPLVRNIVAVAVGWLAGSLVNFGLIMLGHEIYPVEGMNSHDAEAMKRFLPGLSAEYFIFPFLAHALGTLAGAFTAAKIAVSRHMTMALIVGVLFFIGGIAAVFMIPAPTWFVALDLILAYLPMAWIGGKLAGAGKFEKPLV